MKVSLFSFAVLAPTILAQTQQPLYSSQSQSLREMKTISQPSLGFGTWNLNLSPENTTTAVSFAIQQGYRQIDCAAAYGNEKSVGKGIADGLKEAGLKRGDVWVTSKLWNNHHGSYENVEAGFNKTLDDLGLEYLDLYLMHWPVGSSNGENELDYVETWKSITLLPKSRVLNIGVSNFSPKQLNDIITATGVKPAVHQMELHPYLQQSGWITTHEVLGIDVTAYSPLANMNPTYNKSSSSTESLSSSTESSSSSTESSSCSSFGSSIWDFVFGGDKTEKKPQPLLQHPTLIKIADKRNCTTAQVALSWGMSRGISVIPKSSHEAHIKENFNSVSCELGIEDKVLLKGLDLGNRFNNPSKNWGVCLFEGLEGV